MDIASKSSMFFRSIRWRLQMWHGLILLAVLSGFGLTAHRLNYANEMRRIDQELQRRIGPVLEAMRRPPPPGPDGPGGRRPDVLNRGEGAGRERRPSRFEDESLSTREIHLGPGRAGLFGPDTNAFYYVVWLRDGSEFDSTTAAPTDIPMPESYGSSRQSPRMRTRGTMRELYQFTPPGECVLVGRSIAAELSNAGRLALWLLGLGSAVLALGLVGGWWLATRAIRPIHNISSAAAKIATGDLSHRISTDETENELGQLATVLNSTFARLEASFERQRQFTSDASHELRTPIAVILSQTQTILARERKPDEYRDTLEACQRAAQRMRALTESLLTLARLDDSRELSLDQNCDFAQIATTSLELIGPLAIKRGIQLHSDFTAATCLGDADRLGQIVVNLLTNAIYYNHDGGEVKIETANQGDSATLTVWNTGPGIPAEDLPHIFERFYRADKARTRADKHSGLGLSIVSAIVQAHGGSIRADSTTIVVNLPAAIPT